MTSSLSEQRRQSIKLIELLAQHLPKNDPRQQQLYLRAEGVKNGTLPPFVTQNDWEALCQSIHLNVDEIPYRKVLNFFPKKEKDYFNEIKSNHRLK